MVLHCTSPVVQKPILTFNTRFSSGEFIRSGLILQLNAVLVKCPSVTRTKNLLGKQNSSYYWPSIMLLFRQSCILYWDFIIFKRYVNLKCILLPLNFRLKAFLVKCPGVTQIKNLCVKHHSFNILPQFMLISWQSLVVIWELQLLRKKSHIRETKHLPTDADSSTDTTIWWTKNTQKPNFYEKWKKSSKTQKL